jgi:hypothetical protein
LLDGFVMPALPLQAGARGPAKSSPL